MIEVSAMTDAESEDWHAETLEIVNRYFEYEDPATVNTMGVELRMKYRTEKGAVLHGVIDRLDMLADGRIRALDYKTGKAPKAGWEQDKLTQLHIYAAMCEQTLGFVPDVVELFYLSNGERITAEPGPAHLRGVQQRANAALGAITKAAEKGVFNPRPSKLCDYCGFTEVCPGFPLRPGA